MFSDLANILTCISIISCIVVGFISRSIIFKYSDRFKKEIFIWNPDGEVYREFKNIKIIEGISESNIYNIDDLLISSEKNLINIKIYRVEWNPNNGKFKKVGNEALKEIKCLLKGEGLVLRLNIPEGIPNTLIEWEAEDFTKARYIPSFNGLIGNSRDEIEYKKTIKTFFYYMIAKV
ncbi:hypothetical protein [Clostridium baratii]|uniref:hypothetical protein n=1 Tax=Clostridium baratii TaxID=1561 RepID=UPI003D7A59EF